MLRANRTPLSSNSRRLRELGRKDGQDLFSRTIFVNPASLVAGEEIPLSVGMVYSELEIEKAGRHDPRPGPRGHSGHREDNSLYINYEDILQHAVERQQRTKKTTAILMEGVAGVGKTTYLKLLKHNYSCENYSEIKQLEKFDLVISMDCRNSAIESLKELLRDQWPTARQEFDRMGEDMVQHLLGLRCLFLCDGLDETNTASSKLFDNILHKMNQDTMLICTTRPENVDDYYQRTSEMNVDTIHVRIKGIARNKIELFMVKYHEEIKAKGMSRQSTSTLLKYYRTKGHRLSDFYQIPINLVLVIILWALAPERVNQVTTVVALYDEIRVLLTKKALERIRTKSHQTQQEVEANFKQFEKELNKEALICLHKNEIILGQTAIQRLRDCCDRHNLPPDEALGTFLILKNLWENTRVSLEEASFHHKSNQEYHAASCIYDKVVGDKAPLEEIINQVGEVLARCNVRDQDCQEISIFAMGVLERRQQEPSTGRVTILQVLQQVCGEENLNIERFSNTLTMLLGRMYKDGRQTNENYVSELSELIDLLIRSGVRSREQWITVLNSIKCCETVIRLIIDRVPQLNEGKMRIRDNDVFAYSSLLKFVTPQEVQLNIKDNPINIPTLDELLVSVAQHSCPVTELDLEYLFRKGNGDDVNTPLYEGLQRLLSRSSSGVRDYTGPMVDSLRSQTGSLRILSVNIPDEESFFKLRSFLSNTQTLRFLYVCVDLRVDTHILQPLNTTAVLLFPPCLFLPDVTSEDDIEKAGEITKNLLRTTGRNKCFEHVCFPNAQLDQEELVKLLQVLQGVKVSGSLFFNRDLRPSSQTDENNLQQLTKSSCGRDAEIKWECDGVVRGRILDMDSW